MRFLADQDVWAATIAFLRGLGHDGVTASELGMAQADDVDLLATAQQQKRIFVTRDRDFGSLVFVQGNAPGVIYLRILPSTRDAVHAELERVLSLYFRGRACSGAYCRRTDSPQNTETTDTVTMR